MGHHDLLPSHLERVEDALADFIAGRKLTAELRSQRREMDTLGVMADLNPPRKDTPEHTQWRERARELHGRSTRQLTEEIRRLTQINAERVNVIEILREQKNHLEEISTLQSEVIKLFQEEYPDEAPGEAATLLKRAKLLAKS
jgi:hypothetical protein